MNSGYNSIVVEVEADFKKGIPGISIVGLAGTAVREAGDRVRLAIKNSGFDYPLMKIYINLYPGSYKKESPFYDLSIAIKILDASNQFSNSDKKIMILGELKLSGEVCRCEGVLPSVAEGLKNGIDTFIVPVANYFEAISLERGKVIPVHSLEECVRVITLLLEDKSIDIDIPHKDRVVIEDSSFSKDFSDMIGQRSLKRALLVACTGKHNVALFGPPGSGKTMSVERLPTIVPNLTVEESIETTKIYSLAGKLESDFLIKEAPFRNPHHSSSVEGLVGGGKNLLPGEISFAHNGILFLDEVAEFKAKIIQSLREPIEKNEILLARAGISTSYPSNFHLILSMNLCPCGNLGKADSICLCSNKEIQRYRNRVGSAIFDRVDITQNLKYENSELSKGSEVSSAELKAQLLEAREFSKFYGRVYNAKLTNSEIKNSCKLDSKIEEELHKFVRKNGLSSRAMKGLIVVSRTIADLDRSEKIAMKHLEEAFLYRNS